ncbi:MAG: autotransporter-associated beta strand repeat-containing protein, partial [Herbaspirillum sp.]
MTWRTAFSVNSAARSNIAIDGAGNIITAGGSNSQRFLIFSQNSNVSITNATITSQPFTGAKSGLFQLLNISNTIVNLNLGGGTTFRDIGPTDFTTNASADWGPLISVRGGSNTVLNIDGGAAGVTFQGNHGLADQPGTIGLYGNSAINFTGKVSFLGNWTGNYGGAITMFESAGQKMTFAGETTFKNNHASVQGGAIDFWGGGSVMTFDGPVTFQGNYIYGTSINTANYPSHLTTRSSKGGAVHIGYPTTGSNNVNLTSNGTTLFDGNYVIEAKTNSTAYGGALAVDSLGGSFSYVVNLTGPTTFSNNYVYSVSGSGFGGAVYYDTRNTGSFNLGSGPSGSRFINNYAKTLGGAIYQDSGNINLNANGGDITFRGNRQAASFTATGGGLYAPVSGSGNPNAIYLNGSVANSGSLNMSADAGNAIHFYDPIATRSGANATINKTGAGSVIFHGNSSSPGDPLYNSVVYVNTTVDGGTFALTDKVTYGVTTSGGFTVNNGGTVQGADGSTLAAARIAINAGGSVAANGGVFNLNPGSVGATSTAGRFTGFGSIVAPNISLSASAANISTADIAGGNTLTLDTVLSAAGGFNKIGDGTVVLIRANTYTGGTTISAGTLQLGNGGSSGSIVGDITDNAALVINRSDSMTLASVISGTGTLTQAGSGTTILTGNNTYAGGSTISAGTLSISKDINLGAADGPLTFQSGGTLLTTAGIVSTRNVNLAGDGTINNGGNVDTFSEVFSGAGSLIAAGGGTTILTGDNTYAGGTTISAGTLQLGNGGSSGSIVGNIIDNAALVIKRSDSVTLAGVISGTGTLTQAGGGTTILTGDNTYAGGTTISAGTLQLGDGGSSGSIVGNITDNAALVINRGENVTLAGVISGSGTLTQAGSGTTILTANNTYAGGTTISAGTLSIANDANLGAAGSSLTIASGGTLLTTAGIVSARNVNLTGNGTIDNGGNVDTFSGVFSGAGSLTVAGSGTIILTADNTYAGGTTISAGTLQLGDGGGGGSIVGNITDNAVLVIKRSDSVTVAGVISGSGSLTQAGGGTTILTGNNTYTGNTTVSAGTLLVNGSIASQTTTVSSGATLGGSGNIGGDVSIQDGAHLSPGNSPGTLGIAGSLA